MRLARHAWGDGSRLDLYSDVDQSAEAIAAFAGAREADGYRRFCKRAKSIYARCATLSSADRDPAPSNSQRGSDSPASRSHGHIAVHDAVERARRSFLGSAPAPAFRAIRHLLRVVAVPRASDSHAGRSRRARGRLDCRRRHGAPRRGAGGAGERARRAASLSTASRADRRRERPRGGRRDRRGRADRGRRRHLERRRRRARPTEARGPKPRAPSLQPRLPSDRCRP